jgi:uncharacterized protein (TIGR02996 family)
MPRPSPDEAALLKAVCRAPADDLPRLVYADWLEEHGREERAEFIRLQIEVERDTAWSGRWERDKRIAELQRDHAARWLRELPKWALTQYDIAAGFRPAFRRGFVSELDIIAAPFLSYGPQLLDRTPVERLRLQEIRNVTTELLCCVWLREVPQVDLSWEFLGDVGVVGLAGAEWLIGVRELDLSANNVGDLGCRALARSRYATGLRVLGLRCNNITLGGVRFLAESLSLTGVERFELAGNPCFPDDLAAVQRLLGLRFSC